MSCAPEDDTHSRLIECPAHRKSEQIFAIPLARQLFEPLHSRQILRETRRLELGICPAQIILSKPGVRMNLTGEQSPAQRLVSKQGHTVLPTPRNNALGAALKHITGRLCVSTSCNVPETFHL